MGYGNKNKISHINKISIKSELIIPNAGEVIRSLGFHKWLAGTILQSYSGVHQGPLKTSPSMEPALSCLGSYPKETVQRKEKAVYIETFPQPRHGTAQ